MVSMVQLRMLDGAGRVLALLALLALAACAALPPPVTQRAGTEAAAEAAARHGDHAQAASQYENLAAARVPPERVDLQLAAAREWLAAARAADAARVLAAISAPQSAPQSLERSLLEAETALLANRAAGGLAEARGDFRIRRHRAQPRRRAALLPAQDAHRARGCAPGRRGAR